MKKEFAGRRSFLSVAGRSAIAGSVALQVSSQSLLGGEKSSLANIRCDQFTELVGDSFTARVEGRAVPMKLIRASAPKWAHDRRKTGGYREPFSLEFEVAEKEGLAAGVHQVSHPAVGTLPLYMASIGQPTKTTICLEAVIN